MPVQW